MMKKSRLIISLILTGAFITVLSNNAYAESGTIRGDSIRLRQEANTESAIIDTYGDGEKVEIVEKSGEWYKVTIDGETGYIYQDYISKENSSDTTETTKPTEKNEDKKTENEKNQDNQDNKETPKQENKNNTENVPVKLGNVKSSSKQKIYILPNIGSSVIGEIKANSNVNVIQEINGWAYILTDDVSGWARYSKIVNENVTTYKPKENDTEKNNNTTTEQKNNDKKDNDKKDEQNKNTETNRNETTTQKTAYISDDDVNFRAEASTSAEIMDVLGINKEITILEENNGWYKIKVDDVTGYVSKDYVSNSKVTTSRGKVKRENKEDETKVKEEKKEPTKVQKTNKKSTSKKSKVTGNDIVAYAKKYLGYPYVYGAQSPQVGFDCSGLVWYVYKHFGYNVSRTSSALANDGKTISKKSDLKPGDVLIFLAYNDYSRIGHVGIYIGDNKFIHANDESTGIIITSLSHGRYPERFVSGRRIID